MLKIINLFIMFASNYFFNEAFRKQSDSHGPTR